MTFFSLGACVVGVLLLWGVDAIDAGTSGILLMVLLLLLALSAFLVRRDGTSR